MEVKHIVFVSPAHVVRYDGHPFNEAGEVSALDQLPEQDTQLVSFTSGASWDGRDQVARELLKAGARRITWAVVGADMHVVVHVWRRDGQWVDVSKPGASLQVGMRLSTAEEREARDVSWSGRGAP